MHEAATDIHRLGDVRPRALVRRASLLLGVLGLGLCGARRASAQLPPAPPPISNVEDARTLPKGVVLFRAMNAWTRIDQVYDAAADSAQPLHPLGNAFSVESLGVRQFPALLPVQTALRDLTGQPSISLNVGQTFSTADTRIVTTPLSLAYGITDRLTLGVMLPVVQTHTTVFVELNPRRLGPNFAANVGPTPPSDLTALNQQLGAATTDLNAFLANCTASGSCSPQQVQQATTLRDQVGGVSQALVVMYGPGSQYAPLGTATLEAITNHLNALSTSVGQITGGTYSFPAPAGAQAPAALLQLQQLVGAAAYDSLGSPDAIGTGDMEISALFKLVDGFADSTGVRLRATLRGVLRLGTGRPPDGTVLYQVGTGTGQTSADGGAIFDVRLGRRFMATLAGQYTGYFTSAPLPRLPNSDYALFPIDLPASGAWKSGNVIEAEAMPRFLLTDYFTIHGAYTFRQVAASQYTSPGANAPPLVAASTEQRAGLGFGYSAVAHYAHGTATLPLEVFYTHLETIAASGSLMPKYRRDQIEFRI
jgi:hypothetical protein